MDKLLKQFAYILGFTVVMIVAGCSDNIADEITTIETSRLFSPTDFKTQIIDQTSVRLTWKAISNAKSYNIEVSDNEEFAGSPVKTASVTFLEAPYTISGFAEETDYFVRIQAVAEGFTESKWASATFKTGAAPVVLLPFEASDTQVKSVTLHWTAGEAVTAILLTPGDIEHLLTSEEMAAGAATIDGLTAKTAYTAKLMNGTKIRGTLTFTTLSEGGQIITISPANNLKTILEAASNEDVFILTSGTYSSTSDDITISKSISIKGASSTDKPIIVGNVFKVNEGVGLELMDLVLDGTGAATGNQAIIYTEGTFGDLKIENCEIKKYVKGTLYVSDKSLIESVTITGCIYSNIDCTGGDFIDFRKGLTKTLTFTNNTVCNSATSRDLFRMDADGSTNFPEIKSIVTIANNTFDNVCSTSGRMLYIRLANHEVTFNKNIISNSLGTYYASSQYVLTIAQMSQNNYYEAPNYTTAATNRKIDTSSDLTQLNPGYSNASGGIFKVTNAQLISDGIGDPRWLK